MSNVYELMGQELRPVFERLLCKLREFMVEHGYTKPRPPVRVWERRDSALMLASLRCSSRYGPASLRARAPPVVAHDHETTDNTRAEGQR